MQDIHNVAQNSTKNEGADSKCPLEIDDVSDISFRVFKEKGNRFFKKPLTYSKSILSNGVVPSRKSNKPKSIQPSKDSSSKPKTFQMYSIFDDIRYVVQFRSLTFLI